GLHMGLVTGFVFGLVRFSFALYPLLAMRWPTRKIAAGAALAAGVAYLGLSGGAVATERAFIMAAMVFGAVLAGRRALTLRAVALAALIVLALQPEALLGPGFQMSFAATTALILVFRWISDRETFGTPGWLRPPFAVFVSSAVAGAATAPIAAAHFNIVSHYGLIANLASVPVMGAVVMPAAVLAAPLSLIGLEAAPLWVMEQGLHWILGVAHWVSGLDGAVGRLPAPPPVVLPLLAVGALGFALWRGGGRWTGAAACALACALWFASERPSLLISPTGRLVGLMEEDGRALSRARGERFVAESWLENDGDGASQEEAHARGDGTFRLGTQAFVHFTGAKARSATCADAVILVLGDTPDAPLPCYAITPASLRETGALAFSLKQDALLQTTARQVTGRRLWNDAAARQHRAKDVVRRLSNGQRQSVVTLMGTWISN
ncbi:MAG: ComEC/Rec2 family competence protein, partial [Pseudomonadota bacterium]